MAVINIISANPGTCLCLHVARLGVGDPCIHQLELPAPDPESRSSASTGVIHPQA